MSKQAQFKKRVYQRLEASWSLFPNGKWANQQLEKINFIFKQIVWNTRVVHGFTERLLHKQKYSLYYFILQFIRLLLWYRAGNCRGLTAEILKYNFVSKKPCSRSHALQKNPKMLKPPLLGACMYEDILMQYNRGPKYLVNVFIARKMECSSKNK